MESVRDFINFTIISFPDQLKHWQVISVQGGTVMAGIRLYLGCTKFALENDNILHLSVTKISQSEDDLEQSILQ